MTLGDKLAEAIKEATEAHLAEGGGGMVHGVACLVQYIGADGRTRYATAHLSDQEATLTEALVRFHLRVVGAQIDDYIAALRGGE